MRHNIGRAYVTAAAYGWQDVSTERTVTVAGFERLRAGFNANAWSGRIEGGYRFVTPWLDLTPYAAGQFTTYSLPAYAEQVLASAAFVVNGAAQAHDSALLTAAAEMKWPNGWSTAAIFEGQFSGVTNSDAGKGVVRHSW